MTTTDAMKQFLCYVRNDGSTIADVPQTNVADIWEQIGLAFNTRFNGASSTISGLLVTSLPGTAVGTTTITVAGASSSNSNFRYSFGNADLPLYGANLSDWAMWDGTSDIIAEDGARLIIAEVDSSNLAIAAGLVIVNANVG